MGLSESIIAAAVSRSGRSWWQVRYRDGTIISEWETVPLGKIDLGLKRLLPSGIRGFAAGHLSEWEILKKEGLVGVRLLCPNGQAAEIESKMDGMIFQFKTGTADFALSPGGAVKALWADAHVIGAVQEPETGKSECFAWDVRGARVAGPFEENVLDFKRWGVGKLSMSTLDMRV